MLEVRPITATEPALQHVVLSSRLVKSAVFAVERLFPGRGGHTGTYCRDLSVHAMMIQVPAESLQEFYDAEYTYLLVVGIEAVIAKKRCYEHYEFTYVPPALADRLPDLRAFAYRALRLLGDPLFGEISNPRFLLSGHA